jgi:hypothetical protein
MRGCASEKGRRCQHAARYDPQFLRLRAGEMDFGGVFDGDARRRARQVIEQLFPGFRIEPDLHLHVLRTLRPRACSVKKILQNAVLLSRCSRLIVERNEMHACEIIAWMHQSRPSFDKFRTNGFTEVKLAGLTEPPRYSLMPLYLLYIPS